jgi:hypothetical protein
VRHAGDFGDSFEGTAEQIGEIEQTMRYGPGKKR